jgi:hypothetical protein
MLGLIMSLQLLAEESQRLSRMVHEVEQLYLERLKGVTLALAQLSRSSLPSRNVTKLLPLSIPL